VEGPPASRFIENAGTQGPQGPPGPPGPKGPRGPKPNVKCKLIKHGKKIKCKVTFPKKKHATKGRLQVRIARHGHIAALGYGRVSHGTATIVLRELGQLRRGAWTITLVLSQSHHATSTVRMGLRVT
jgi:hypothetical protein